MDQVRNPDTTYRLNPEPVLRFEYPDRVENAIVQYSIVTYPPRGAPITHSTYRFDALPKWMQEAMHLLDWGGEVHGLGRKVGTTYWIEPVDRRGP